MSELWREVSEEDLYGGTALEAVTIRAVPVKPDYDAAQRMYERHVDAAVFDMVLSRTGGKAIVDAALGADDE